MDFPLIRNRDTGRELQPIFQLNDVEILGLIAGTDTFYNLNLIHAAAGYPKQKWPELYVKTPDARQYLRELAETFGLPESSFYRINGDQFLATKKLMLDYAEWISPRFKLMVHQAAERGAPAMLAEHRPPVRRPVERSVVRLEGIVVRRSFTDVVAQFVEPKLVPDRKGKLKNQAFPILSDEVNLAAFERHTWDVKRRLGLSMNGNIRDALNGKIPEDPAAASYLNLIKSIEGLFAVHVPLLALQSSAGRISVETAKQFIRSTREFSKGLVDVTGRLSLN